MGTQVMGRAIWRLAAALAASAAATTAAGGDDAAGVSAPYLVARHAALSSDYATASRHYAAALARDPGNPAVMESAISASLAAGETARAAAVARAMEDGGRRSQLGAMALLVERAAAGEWQAILDAQAEGRTVGPLVDALGRGWALLGRGEGEAALAEFRALAGSRGLAGFGRLHEALARAALEDWAGAERLLSGRDEAGRRVAEPLRLSRRTALARIAILSRLDRNHHALALLDHLFGDRLDPPTAALRARLAAGERVAYPGPRDARGGMAEALLTVATALRGDAAHGYVLLYARSAEALAPEHGDATLLTASLLHGLRRHEAAQARYDAVSPDDPAYPSAQMGRARALRALGRGAEAVAVLRALGERRPRALQIHLALGDALGAQGRPREAVAAYDRALATLGDPARAPWRLHYARAVAREGAGDRAGARADLGRALEIEPDEPRVLHRLGSAMIERGEPAGEALALIERAAEAAPEDAAVAGSLGLALHRLGRVAEAVAHLERAAALEPLDRDAQRPAGRRAVVGGARARGALPVAPRHRARPRGGHGGGPPPQARAGPRRGAVGPRRLRGAGERPLRRRRRGRLGLRAVVRGCPQAAPPANRPRPGRNSGSGSDRSTGRHGAGDRRSGARACWPRVRVGPRANA